MFFEPYLDDGDKLSSTVCDDRQCGTVEGDNVCGQHSVNKLRINQKLQTQTTNVEGFNRMREDIKRWNKARSRDTQGCRMQYLFHAEANLRYEQIRMQRNRTHAEHAQMTLSQALSLAWRSSSLSLA